MHCHVRCDNKPGGVLEGERQLVHSALFASQPPVHSTKSGLLCHTQGSSTDGTVSQPSAQSPWCAPVQESISDRSMLLHALYEVPHLAGEGLPYKSCCYAREKLAAGVARSLGVSADEGGYA